MRFFFRRKYSIGKLHRSDLNPDPLKELQLWLNKAARKNIIDYNAMVLSTVDSNGIPNSRVVLLKEISQGGLVFYTNYQSAKAREIEYNPNVALLFFWPELEKQVRIQGLVTKISEEENDKYFFQRDYKSQAASIASQQSQPISSRKELLRQFNEVLSQNKLTRPPYWGGYRVNPFSFEFWQGREYRLNDRFQYRLENDKWIIQRLAP